MTRLREMPWLRVLLIGIAMTVPFTPIIILGAPSTARAAALIAFSVVLWSVGSGAAYTYKILKGEELVFNTPPLLQKWRERKRSE